LTLPKTITKKADLFHWSWAWIQTQCDILFHQKAVDDNEQSFLLREFQRLLGHPATGLERFTQMGPAWRDVLQAVTNKETLRHNAPEVEQTVDAWFQELRDMSLLLSSHVGQPVSVKIDRALSLDVQARRRDACKTLVADHKLVGTFVVPDAASDIDVCADLARKSVVLSMKLRAPQDRKTAKARVGWLLRMLKRDDPRLVIRAHWPGRKQPSQKDLAALVQDVDLIDPERSGLAPHGFEVLLIATDPKRFAGRRTFIEDLETCATDFYDLVGQHLRAWQAPPPKPVSAQVQDRIAADMAQDDIV
jgi:hypothetical protein